MKIFIFFIFLPIFNVVSGQEIILLQDTILNNAGINYSHKSRKRFDKKNEKRILPNHYQVRRYALTISDFFWEPSIRDSNNFDTLFCYSYNPHPDKSKTRLLRFLTDTESDTTFKENDSTILIFSSASNKDYQLKVPVRIDKIDNNLLKLKLQTIKYGYSDVLSKYINVWPYQSGVQIFLSDSIEFNFFDNRFLFRLEEKIKWNDTLLYSFIDYNHMNEWIKLEKNQSKDFNGYRPDFFLSPELISVNKLTILYFGGHWCYPCKDEIPKLKKINELSYKYNYNLKTFLVYKEGDRFQAESYYTENLKVMNNTFLTFKDKIINQLNITSYPTYIICNDNGKILYRSDYSSEDTHTFIWNLIKMR